MSTSTFKKDLNKFKYPKLPIKITYRPSALYLVIEKLLHRILIGFLFKLADFTNHANFVRILTFWGWYPSQLHGGGGGALTVAIVWQIEGRYLAVWGDLAACGT